MADTKICYSFIVADDSCHTYRSDDFGTTWVEQQSFPNPDVSSGEFHDYAMATQDEDYNTQVTFFDHYMGDFHHYAAAISPDGRSSTWRAIDPSNFPGMGITQTFVTGAISAGGQTILAPVLGATDPTATYPRISNDFGATWRDITDFGTGRSWGPCCFAANKAKMYMAWEFGSSGGISVSSDGGSTWFDLPGVPSASIVYGGDVSGQRLRSSLDGSAIIYVDNSANAIFSRDSGGTWTILNDPIGLTTLFPFLVNSSSYADCAISGDGKIVLVSFAALTADTYPYQSVLFGSRDFGATWIQLAAPSILDPTANLLLDCNISNDARAVVCAFQDVDTLVYRVDMSLDSGVTWKSVDMTSQRVELTDFWTTAFAFPNTQPPPLTSLFVASASDASGPETNAMSSEDGSSWTLQTTPAGSGDIAFNGVVYSVTLGLFCAVGNTNGTDQTAVMTSPDGVTWTFRDLPQLLSLTSVTWSQFLGIFIAVGSGSDGSQFGYVFTSPDGIVWTKQTCPVGKWVSVYTDPTSSAGSFIIAVSSDYNGTTFPYSVMHSEDSTAWTGIAGQVSNTAAGGWAAVIYAGWAGSSSNNFVAVGGDSASASTTGAIMYSNLNNPDVWTLAAHPAHTGILGVAYEPKDDRVVAVGAYDAGAPTKSGALYSNNHGHTWSSYTPIEGKWSSLIWAHDLEFFVAVGGANGSSTNIVMTSPDGIAWTAQSTEAAINSKTFSGVAYRIASPTGDACILVPLPPFVPPKGGYIIERFDNRVWPTVEDAWCVDCAFALARPTPGSDLNVSSATGAGILTGVTNLIGGANYSGATTVQVVDGNGLGPGTGAIAILTITSGVIVAISFSAGGSGYIYPKLVFNDPENTGSGASATITMDNSVTFFASTPVFVPQDVGSVIRVGYGVADITAFTDAQTVTANLRSPIINVQPDDPDPGAVQTQLSGTWTMTKPISQFYLPTLAGFEITGLADGRVIPPVVVPANGIVTLAQPASAIIVGLGFQAQLQSTYLDAGEPTVQAQRKKVAEVSVRVEQSASFQAGGNQPDGSVQSPQQLAPLWQNMIDVPSPAVPPFNSAAQQLFTGDIRVPIPSGFNTRGQVAVQQLKPLPLQVLDYVPEVLSGDKPAQEAPKREQPQNGRKGR